MNRVFGRILHNKLDIRTIIDLQYSRLIHNTGNENLAENCKAFSIVLSIYYGITCFYFCNKCYKNFICWNNYSQVNFC